MATKTSQRVFIWVIAIVMTVGTIAGFIAMMLAPQNAKVDQNRLQSLAAQYQKDYESYQKTVSDQTATLSAQYFSKLNAYNSRVAAFDKNSVKELGRKDLKVGEGGEIKDNSTFAVYYIGWNPSGKKFDSSLSEGGKSLEQPLLRNADKTWTFSGGQQGGVIEGWTEGIKGMKVGGVRELTIPSDKAYKDQAQGADIPPNTPLKFIIMVIPAPEKIMTPEIPEELARQYGQ